MERKLASIRVIEDLQPIEGADRIEVATIDGWRVVVRKGEFTIGDMCVYFEIDSILPERPEFEFMRDRHFRVRTIKLKKQISQGIAFPLTILPHYMNYYLHNEGITIGDDVTEFLGIKEYEPTISACLSGIVKGNFPDFLIKTDEERVQNLKYLLEWCQDMRLYVSEKLDGTSMTCYLKDGEFGVCSRRLDLKESENNLYWKIARRENIEEKLRKYAGDNIAIQGELIGSGIQGNKYGFKPDEYAYKIFNVFSIKVGEFLNCYYMEKFCSECGLYIVPILEYDFYLNHTIDELLIYADGQSVIGNTIREGLVFRAFQETYHPKVGRVSFKAVSNQFLLNYGE